MLTHRAKGRIFYIFEAFSAAKRTHQMDWPDPLCDRDHAKISPDHGMPVTRDRPTDLNGTVRTATSHRPNSTEGLR